MTHCCIVSPGHPLASKGAVRPDGLDGMRGVAPGMRVIGPLREAIEGLGVYADVREMPLSMLHFSDAVEGGGACLFSVGATGRFPDRASVPLDLDLKNCEKRVPCGCAGAHFSQFPARRIGPRRETGLPGRGGLRGGWHDARQAALGQARPDEVAQPHPARG